MWLRQRKVALFLLAGVEFEDGVQSVEEVSDLIDVRWARIAFESLQQIRQSVDHPRDLHVPPGHHRGGVRTAERFGDHRIQMLLLGTFVGFELESEQRQRLAGRTQLERLGAVPYCVGELEQSVQSWPQAVVLIAEASGDGGPPAVEAALAVRFPECPERGSGSRRRRSPPG